MNEIYFFKEKKEPKTIIKILENVWFTLSYYLPSKISGVWGDIKHFFRNLRKYWVILREDSDNDYLYFTNLIIFKLERMADYFRTSRVAGNEHTYEQINTAIRLAKIAFQDNDDEDSYVNIKNKSRFTNMLSDNNFKEENCFYRQYLNDLRSLKARYVFFLYLQEHYQSWWD